jgi:hypothetical protein
VTTPAEGAVAATRIGRGARLLFTAFGALTALALVVLYVLAGSTDRFFAWTIDPPITAALLGAGYRAGVVGIEVARRRQDPGRSRSAVLPADRQSETTSVGSE